MSRVSVITNRGVSVVRSAQSKLKTVSIVGAVSSTHFENTANELATKSGEWWDGATGTITMVRAGNGSLKVSVSFPATSYAQPLKSVGILVKAQGDERAHILYAVSDGNTAIALNRPYTCDYEIPINVSSDTIEDVGSEPVPGLEDYYTKSETDTAIGNAITALNLGAASQKGVDTSIGDASSSNLPTSDAVKAYVDAHSGGGGDTSNLGASLAYDSKAAQIELRNTSDAVISSISTNRFGSLLYYDSNTKRIELKNTIDTVISSIDATAFVKDGMVNNVAIEGDYLVVTFNTDAGKEAINIPMSSFFDASAYYTREQIDGGYYTKSQVDTKLEDYCTKTEINDGYYTKSEVDNKGYCTEAEVNTNLENYYTKTEINDGYYSKVEINDELNHYYTKTEINNGYYTKSECYSKSEIDGGYIANASYNNATNTLTLSSKDGSKQIDLDLS